MDMCFPSPNLDLVAHFCNLPPICTQVDNIHQICHPATCPPSPVQYECISSDGKKYKWENSLEDSRNAAK